MKKTSHPRSEGWLTVTVTLTTRELQPIEVIKDVLSFGRPDNYEFASIVQTGSKVKAILRQKPNPNPDIKPPELITVTEGWKA